MKALKDREIISSKNGVTVYSWGRCSKCNAHLKRKWNSCFKHWTLYCTRCRKDVSHYY